MAAKPKTNPAQDDLDDIPAISARNRTDTKVSTNKSGEAAGKNITPEPQPKPNLEKTKKKKKEKGSIGRKIFPIFLILLILVSLVGILYYNVFGIRDKYLRSTLNKIPIIGSLLPPAEEGYQDAYSDMNREELIATITKLEDKLTDEQAINEDLNNRITLYLQQISNLKVFEEQQLSFKEEKAEFDRLIAEGDPTAYAKFYESISPENAEDLYKGTADDVALAAELRRYIKTISAMDTNSAAKMLEELIPTDMDIVVNIMKGLQPELNGEILSAMTKEFSSAVIKRMTPN